MKVLVTGVNGFLAANIVRELIVRNYSVRGLLRFGCNELPIKGVKIEKIYGNITCYQDVVKAVDTCDYVIHAAAITAQNATPEAYEEVNVRGTKNVIDAVQSSPAKKMIFVGTANTFSFGTRENPGDETREIDPLFAKSPYARSKTIAQEMVLTAVNEGRINAMVINPTFMIGPYDAKPSSGRIILMHEQQKILFVPPGGKSFVHVRDVAIAVCNGLEKGKNGACYLVTNENLSYKEFFRKVAGITGSRKIRLETGRSLVKFLGELGSFKEKMGIKSELNKVNASLLLVDNFYQSRKAEQDLGLTFQPVEKAIREAVEWFLANGYLKKNHG